MEEFSFIIAKKWNDTKPSTLSNLGVYTYFQEIHTSTLEGAKSLLSYVQSRSPEYKYKIYPVTLGDSIE